MTRLLGGETTDLAAGEMDELDEGAPGVLDERTELPSASAKESAELTRSMAREMAGTARAVADATTLAFGGITKARADNLEPDAVLALQYMPLPSGRWRMLLGVSGGAADGVPNFVSLEMSAMAEAEARGPHAFAFGRLCTTVCAQRGSAASTRYIRCRRKYKPETTAPAHAERPVVITAYLIATIVGGYGRMATRWKMQADEPRERWWRSLREPETTRTRERHIIGRSPSVSPELTSSLWSIGQPRSGDLEDDRPEKHNPNGRRLSSHPGRQ